MENEKLSTVQELLNTGAAATTHSMTKDGIPYVAMPKDYAIKDLESLLAAPIRKRANIILIDHASFIAYVKAHGKPDHTVMYVNVDFDDSVYTIKAIIDDHGHEVADARWRDHVAILKPKLSHEWKTWKGNHKARFSQSKFAEFIEDNMADIASVEGSPNASDMLQMALAFESNSNKKFKRRVDLQSGGASLEYVDEQDETTSTKMKFFERFYIGIPAFQGETSAYPIEARLKYRLEDGRLMFWFELIRLDRVFKQAIEDKIATVEKETGFMLLYGSP